MATGFDSLKYVRGDLLILDQLKLPDSLEYLAVKNADDAWSVIKKVNIIFQLNIKMKYNYISPQTTQYGCRCKYAVLPSLRLWQHSASPLILRQSDSVSPLQPRP